MTKEETKKDKRIDDYGNVTDLKKYDRIYRVVNDGTNGPDLIERVWEWCIPGKYGQIYPVGFNGDLGVFSEHARIASRLEAAGFVPIQGKVAFRFGVSRIAEAAVIIGAYRSRKGIKPPVLTEDQRKANTARIIAVNAGRKMRAGSACARQESSSMRSS